MWHDPLVAISYRVASPGARLSTDKTNSKDDYIWTTICLFPSSMFRVGRRYLLSPFGQSAIIRERLFMVFRLLRPEDCCKGKGFVFLVYDGEEWVRERGNIGFYAEIVLKYTSLLCGFLLSKTRLESFQTSPDVFGFSKIHMLFVSQRLFNKSNLFLEKNCFHQKQFECTFRFMRIKIFECQ